jgi:hypothetical protein
MLAFALLLSAAIDVTNDDGSTPTVEVLAADGDYVVVPLADAARATTPRLVRGDPALGIAVLKAPGKAGDKPPPYTLSTPAARLLVAVTAPLVLDRATPRAAFESCTRALELGAPASGDCWDWRSHSVVFRKRLERARENVKGGAKGKAVVTLETWLAGDGAEAAWIERFRPLALSLVVDGSPAAFGSEADRFFAYLTTVAARDVPRPRAKTRDLSAAELRAVVPVDATSLAQPFGIRAAAADPRAILRALKMGLRVDDVAQITQDKAWLSVAGRNVDGTHFRYASFWKKSDSGWAEAMATRDDDVTRPKHFPPWFSFALAPHTVVTSFAQGPLSAWLASADPSAMAVDPDFEHVFPAMLDALAARP